MTQNSYDLILPTTCPISFLLDLRALETSTENNRTVLFIVFSLERLSCFFFYLHMSRIAFVSKNIQPLSMSRSRQWIKLMFWQTARRLTLLILDFGNKENKLGNHSASRFNLKITELKSIYLANALIFPPCPIIFSWGVQRVYTHLRLVGLTLHRLQQQ